MSYLFLLFSVFCFRPITTIDIVTSVAAGQQLVITPTWYSYVITARKFFPALVDNVLLKAFAPTPKKK
jgi:hypothetical protein